MQKSLIVILVSMFCAGLFANENLVFNGDFKQGDRYWHIPKTQTGQFLIVPANKPDGPALKVIGAAKPDGYARISSQIKPPVTISLKPGDTVLFKAKIKCVKLSGKFQIMFRQANAKGKSLSYDGATLRKRYKCAWKLFSRKIKIKPHATRFYIFILSAYLDKEDTVFVKDISLQKISLKN